jgi:hypothetical protein
MLLPLLLCLVGFLAYYALPTPVVPSRDDPPQLHLVRAALFDRSSKTFHGNIHTILCSKTTDKGATWQFAKQQRIVSRSFLEKSLDLHVYLEFNISYALTRKGPPPPTM